jgi:hypothetical protein
MSALIRKRAHDRPETWYVHYAGVRVGAIVERCSALTSSGGTIGYRYSRNRLLLNGLIICNRPPTRPFEVIVLAILERPEKSH